MIQPADARMAHPNPEAGPSLRRELGRWDLTAIGVNQVIGGAMFLVPATLAAHLGGGWSWIAFSARASSRC